MSFTDKGIFMKISVFRIAVATAVSTLITGCGGTTEDDYDVDTNGGMIRWYQSGTLTDDTFSPVNGSYLIELASDEDGIIGYDIERFDHSGNVDLSERIAAPGAATKEIQLSYIGTPDEAVAMSNIAFSSELRATTASADFFRVSDRSHTSFVRDVAEYDIAYTNPQRIDPVNKDGVFYFTNQAGGWAISAGSVVPADTIPTVGTSFPYSKPPTPDGYVSDWYNHQYGNKEFRLHYLYKVEQYREFEMAYLSVYEIGKPEALWHAPIDALSDETARHDFDVTEDGVFIHTWADENGCVGTLLKYDEQGVTERKKVACGFSVKMVGENNDFYGEVSGDLWDRQVHVIQHRDENDNVLQEYRMPARADNFPGRISKFKQLSNGRFGLVIGNKRDSTGFDTPWNAEYDETFADDVVVLNSDFSLHAHFPFHEYRYIRKLHWFWPRFVPLQGSTDGYSISDVFMSNNGDVYFTGMLLERDVENGMSYGTPRFGVIH